MTRRFAYDPAREPAAPLLPLGVARPLSGAMVLLRALVHGGACSVVPSHGSSSCPSSAGSRSQA